MASRGYEWAVGQTFDLLEEELDGFVHVWRGVVQWRVGGVEDGSVRYRQSGVMCEG